VSGLTAGRRSMPLGADTVWIDVRTDGETGGPDDLVERFGLDHLAMHDAVNESDLPKLDDFADHLVVTFHALMERDGRLATTEIDAFVSAGFLVTVRHDEVRGIDWLWDAMEHNPALAEAAGDVVLSRLLEVVTRRYVPLVTELEDRIEQLTDKALAADPEVLSELSALRRDELTIRRILTPQREMLDELRRAPLLSEEARRRVADTFDLDRRLVAGFQAARSQLTDVLTTYQGSAAQQLTEVSKVLTIYAAILLPLSLLVGFFGMNFPDLPGIDQQGRWWIVLIAGVVVGLVSWLLFLRRGFVQGPRVRPSVVGRGLAAGAKLPVKATSVFVSTAGSALRIGRRRTRGA
jgi:magnesium transporter